MCCGRKPSRPSRGKSGKITRTKNIQALTNDHIENRERLHPSSDGEFTDKDRTVDPPEIQGQELLP